MSSLDFYIDVVCDNTASFDCGFEVFNNYVKGNKPNDFSVIHYIIDAETEKLIAYFSLLASALMIGSGDSCSAIPAIELKMFAVDRQYRKKGYALALLEAALMTIEKYSLECVGAQISFLHSVNVDYVISFYKDCGFKLVSGALSAYKSIFNDGCVPMFKVLN